MEELQLERHLQLWGDNNKQIKRIIFLTAVISVALIIKVLVPYVDYSGDKRPLLDNIDVLKHDKQVVNEKIRIIEKAESTLKDVARFIEDQPWQKEKNDLIDRYKRMRLSPPAEGYSPERYQREADQTIKEIGRMLDANIALPLQRSAEETAGQHSDLARLNREISSLRRFVVDWENEYIGKQWYATISEKERAMSGLTGDLNSRLDRFSDVVEAELDNVKKAREAVDKKLAELNKQIAVDENTLEGIEEELQAILPEWLSGLVRTEQVIQLLPVVLLGAAIYVFAIGLALTRHYRVYITGKQLDEGVAHDPVMSSTWTLVRRGRLGTIQTIIAYGLFFAFSWVMLEKTVALLFEWLAIDDSKAWIGERGPWAVFLWMSRLAFVLLLAYVVAAPWRKTHRQE